MAVVILITVGLSAIIAAFFAIEALVKGLINREESRSLFDYSFYGGLIGGLIGSIIGAIFGAVFASFTPSGANIIVFSGIDQAIVFMKIFLPFWIISTMGGAIYAGLRWCDENID